MTLHDLAIQIQLAEQAVAARDRRVQQRSGALVAKLEIDVTRGLGIAALFSLAAPWLLDGGVLGQDLFILIGFVLLGLSYGQASGAVTSNFEPRFRYTGAALTYDFAWLFGAAFAPLVALGLSAKFGLVAVTVYLLSGCVCTLLALRISRTLGVRA